MESFPAIEMDRCIGEFPVFVTDINTLYDLINRVSPLSIEMSDEGITTLDQGQGCYTLGISSCLGGLQFTHGVYTVFHSYGRSIPNDAFQDVEDGLLFTGHADTWKAYAHRLQQLGNSFAFPPGFDFKAWCADPWNQVYAISFAFVPATTISEVTPGLYVAYTN